MKPVRPAPTTKARPDASRRRAFVVVTLLCCWMVVIGARLVYLQTSSRHEWLSARARVQQQRRVAPTAPVRGLILDRQGRELARSVEAASFFAVPSEVEDAADAAARLARALRTEARPLAERLRQAKEARRPFVWIARKVDDDAANAVRDLRLKGVYERNEAKRRYPNGDLAAHVIGFAGTDERGLAGVEQFHDAALMGEPGKLLVEGDARRKGYGSFEVDARPGQTLVLTIDRNVQHMAETALRAAVARARAKSGAAIVLDPRTGEILALANAPAFDPNEASRVPDEARRNDALQNIYEPGSTFKVVAYSAAIEERLAKPDDRIDCLGGGITVAGRFVRDHTPYGLLTMTEALAKSSNVAAIKLGLRVGNERMYDYMRRFGFGARTGVELPGETAGLVRRVGRWQASSIGSIAIGQEVGVTPLQMVSAFGALANDGVRVAPHLVREVRNEDGSVAARATPESRRVVSAETAQTVRGMLEMVTIKGTAKAARLEGYTAAGKTGTAQKIDPDTRAYSPSKHVASFVGFAPVERPAAVIVVVIDEPIGAYHGGDVAAPIFREIAEQVLPYLEVAPDVEITQPAGVERLLARARREAAGVDESIAGENEISGEERHRNAWMPEAARREEVVYAAAGDGALLMPDLRGRSVRDAAQVCSQLGLELEASGEGLAVRQHPAAGAGVQAGQLVRIEFARGD